MYGKNIPDIETNLVNISQTQDIIIIIGSEKIPPELISLSDVNVAISNQPHSEVSALAISLSRINENYLSKDFDGPLKVIPTSDHREMVNTDN